MAIELLFLVNGDAEPIICQIKSAWLPAWAQWDYIRPRLKEKSRNTTIQPEIRDSPKTHALSIQVPVTYII